MKKELCINCAKLFFCFATLLNERILDFVMQA